METQEGRSSSKPDQKPERYSSRSENLRDLKVEVGNILSLRLLGLEGGAEELAACHEGGNCSAEVTELYQ